MRKRGYFSENAKMANEAFGKANKEDVRIAQRVTRSKCGDRKENICVIPKVTPLPFIRAQPKLKLMMRRRPIARLRVELNEDHYAKIPNNTASLNDSLSISRITLGGAVTRHNRSTTIDIMQNKHRGDEICRLNYKKTYMNTSKVFHSASSKGQSIPSKTAEFFNTKSTYFNSSVNFPRAKRPKTKLSQVWKMAVL
eukprot:TRINITY_DN15220_c0_g1_i2.p1 TRINITY_DN15220_c0_g1~~TRINITY_DN15220_c0_g1_i2.p1  ORF type:complete len:196 (+),score=26.41 TRINITY_DN15220_c0_g1_i2:365-952(+)